MWIRLCLGLDFIRLEMLQVRGRLGICFIIKPYAKVKYLLFE
jgi:hypothetical protein